MSLTGLYGDTDMARVMYGQNARHVPAWMYVQAQGIGQDGSAYVGLIGASRVPAGPHPLRYGTGHQHHLIVGEIIVRPHVVVGTDAMQGYGAGSLFLGPHDEAFADGQLVIGTDAMLRRVREQWER